MKVLGGAAFSIWWMMCGSVATMIVVRVGGQRELQDGARRAHLIGMIEDEGRAFGMGGHGRAGVQRLQLQELRLGEGLVHDARARPEQHVAAHLPG